jgi:hypothetical protein
MKHQLLSLFLTLAAAPGAVAQDLVQLLRPSAGGGYELVACDLSDGRPIAGNPIAIGLVPEACALNGLSALEQLDRAAGAIEALPGGGHILRLPAHSGSLMLLRRDAGTVRYGWWFVGPDGRPRRLIELAGTGPQGTDNPFLPRAAGTPDGTHAMFATTLAAGGNLFVAPIATPGPVEDRTATLPPLDFRAESLLCGREFGVATHTSGAVVVPRASGAQVRRVHFQGGTPAEVSGSTVLSPRGTRAAVIAGPSDVDGHAWVFGADGVASCANDTAMLMAGAGHYPEAVNGPWLAVSDDGMRCAWRATEGVKTECYSVRLDVVSPQVEHLTSDANYIDTLDQIGQLGFMAFNSLLMGVGETLPGGGFDRVDLFEVKFEANGTISQRNLTASSGQTLPPFTLPPAIESMQIMRSAVSDRVLIYDDQGSNGQLLIVQAGISGSTVVLDDVRELDWVRRVGDELWFSAERDFGSSRPRHIFRTDGGLTTTPTILIAGGEDLLFESPVIGSDWIAFRRALELGPVTLERAFADGTHQVIIPASIPILDGPVLLPSDHLGVIAQNANGPRGIVIRPDLPRGWLLRTAVPTGTFLLGN